MKRPSFQFYPGDWMKDPCLSLCEPATRGLWIDALCAMHELQSGTLSGSLHKIARLLRCSESDLRTALEDLKTTNAADVTLRHNEVTMRCRRLERELNTRENSRLRKAKERSHEGVTKKSHPPSSSSSSTSVSFPPDPPGEKEKKKPPEDAEIPSLDEVMQEGQMQCIPPEVCRKFFDYYDGLGWMSGNTRIRKWQSFLRSYAANHREPGRPPAASKASDRIGKEKKLDRLKNQLSELKADMDLPHNQTDANRKQLNALRQQIRQVEQELNDAS